MGTAKRKGNDMRADVSKIRVNRQNQVAEINQLDYVKANWDGYLGEFRVTLMGLTKEREEELAYYTNDFEDALLTGKNMSDRVREFGK